MQLFANISLMFTEQPLPERFAAARRAGFEGVEMQFPYDHEAQDLRQAADGLPVCLINAPASDARGKNGRSTDPACRAEFAEGIEQAVRYAEALGVRKVNVIAGPPPMGQPDDVTRDILLNNTRLAANRLSEVGAEVVLEAFNPVDLPGVWLEGLDRALAFLTLADPRLRLQFDLYHMFKTEFDLVAAIERAAHKTAHVQFADDPGRHEPGTGQIDFDKAFEALRRTGYDGVASAEYRPAAETEAGLGWMSRVPGWFGRSN